MWVSRVRVNGGFLAGLDVALTPGLNVVVGPRGAGKTTLLELIRHALGIEHADQRAAKRQQEAIAQLLGAGEVVLELQGEGTSSHIVVDASGNGRSAENSSLALALGQNELEQIASNSTSRLHLIDLRAAVDAESPSFERAGALTSQIAAMKSELSRLADNATKRTVLLADREDASAEEQSMLSDVASDISGRREVLRGLEVELLQLVAQKDAAAAAIETATGARQLTEKLARAIDRLESNGSTMAIRAIISPRAESIRSDVDGISRKIDELNHLLVMESSATVDQQNKVRVQAEPVRAELEAAESGLGQVTARLRNIDAELAALERSDSSLRDQLVQLESLEAERNALLDEFESWQETLFEARKSIAESVTQDLENRVVVSVEHLSDTWRFRDVLVALLQGSGLQYRPLSEALAKSLLPRQLLAFVEADDADGLASASGLTSDRAARLIAQLSTAENLSAIAMCMLEDRVDFKLRDGAVEKSVEQLSTGQKCSVTLPIVLTELSRVLILDQPEDHLDNAYLVKNVVNSLENRGEHGAQTIVATHNANIPVLGAASNVLVMESDGTRGFVAQRGSFDDDAIVAVITSLMEGGREAFQRRAQFYSEHDVPNN